MTPPAAPIRFLLKPTLEGVKEHVRAELFSRALSQRLGRPVVVEIAPSDEALERELLEERVDLAWGTSEQCTAFEPRTRAVLRAVRSGRWSYHAALVCRADAPLTLETLRGTRAAWVDAHSTGGYLLPVRHLLARGQPPAELFSEERFLGSYRQALLAVLAGEADVAAIYTSHPEENTVRAWLAEHVGFEERRLTPFAFTEPTLSDGLIITRRLPEAEAATLVSLLTSLASEGAGLEPLRGLFDSEGFVLAPAPEARPGPPRHPARQAEYLAAELGEGERCLRLWTPAARAFGREVREAGGRTLAQVVGPEAGEPLEALVRSARHNGVVGRMEFRLLAEGEPRCYLAEATPRAGGTVALLVREVTELRALEDELYRLASFPLLHPEPMLELTREGALRYANPAASTAFPDLLLRGARHPLVEAALAARPTLHLGGHHWELTVAPLREADGLRVFAQDVTTRKQMEARLIQADRLSSLGFLASSIGHEMNNPLAFMLANLAFASEELERLGELLRERGSGDLAKDLVDVADALGETAEGANRLKDIISDLRMLSRAPPAERELVDVASVLEHTLSLIRGELRHRARLEKALQPVPPVEGDAGRLGQVFLHLLLNAVQAMNEQDAARNVLRVATHTGPGGEVVVEVRDTGAGMAPEVLARIFEPFFTLKPGSTGMGLSVSHALVTSLGGTLRAESQEGVGSTLTVMLPPASASFSEDE
ncbi:MAG TPA: PhnD/SsuA/transferrin family substrate-binding protein [Myxococcaceae bacterium]|nr:PhnD/SsuA/transferrin family substrate-binding protein [Myxococcaceae bacterium]